nr:hypothetical protein BaRGS_005902 [Batillaria attramentaria]
MGGAAIHGGRVDLDPTVFLNTARSGEGALYIPDFISFCDDDDDNDDGRQSIELGGGVVIRLAKKKPRLDSVSPAQYLAANSRILARLIEVGRLSGQGIIDYLAYTAKVGEMATRYTWQSVLTYDHQYRASQAAYGFSLCTPDNTDYGDNPASSDNLNDRAPQCDGVAIGKRAASC